MWSIIFCFKSLSSHRLKSESNASFTYEDACLMLSFFPIFLKAGFSSSRRFSSMQQFANLASETVLRSGTILRAVMSSFP